MIPYLKPTLFLNSISFGIGFNVRNMYKVQDTKVLFSEYVEVILSCSYQLLYRAGLLDSMVCHRILTFRYFCLKFVYSEKATKFCEISPLLLFLCTVDKSKVEISQNFASFSENTNFNQKKKFSLKVRTIFETK